MMSFLLNLCKTFPYATFWATSKVEAPAKNGVLSIGVTMHCKIAESEDVRQYFAQVHCVGPHAENPDEHLLRRLDSIQHKRATWIVGKTGGAVVCSLGAYPIELKGPDGTLPTRAFGAVFTSETQRGQGRAAQLLNWVMDHYAAVGVQDFVLFSDIDPGYYQRLVRVFLSEHV